MSWQPIETAPKDGTVIDVWAVWDDDKDGQRIPNVHWGMGYIPFESEEGEKEGWVGEYEGVDGCEGLIDTESRAITHWMPLPAPPEGTGA